MTLVLIIGGIDLSVGAVMAMSGDTVYSILHIERFDIDIFHAIELGAMLISSLERILQRCSELGLFDFRPLVIEIGKSDILAINVPGVVVVFGQNDVGFFFSGRIVQWNLPAITISIVLGHLYDPRLGSVTFELCYGSVSIWFSSAHVILLLLRRRKMGIKITASGTGVPLAWLSGR